MGGVSKWKPIRGQEAEEPEEETNQDKQMQPNWDSSGEGREEVGCTGREVSEEKPKHFGYCRIMVQLPVP